MIGTSRRRAAVTAGALVAASLVPLASPGQAAPVRSGSWAPTASMAEAREGGGAGNGYLTTTLLDGRVLVAGGFTTKPSADMFTFLHPQNYLSGAELYDPATGTWERTGSMQESRFGPAMATLSTGKVLVAGGFGGGVGTYRKTAELYDPASGTWSFVPSMSTCRAGATISSLASGKILLAGGLDCFGQSQASAEIFDPGSLTWSPAGSLTVGRQAHTATTLGDGRVVVAGGRSTNGMVEQVLNSAEVYDPEANTWAPTGSLNVARAFHIGAGLSPGTAIVAGGRCPGQSIVGPSLATDCKTTTAELYDPSTGTWSLTGSLNAPRLFAGSVVLPGKGPRSQRLLVAGGSQEATAELYDPATGTWSPTATMSRIRGDAPLTLLSTGDVLIVGGFEVTSPYYRTTETAELYRAGRR